MVVDTSALVAIMGDEPERHRFNRLIEAATATCVSVASLLETRIVLFARSGDSAVLALDAFMLRSFPPALRPGVVMAETGVVSQELPTGPGPAWSWEKQR